MKVIKASREDQGKWTFEFSDNIRQRDVNALKQMLVVEYSRKKYRERIARKKRERQATEASTVDRSKNPTTNLEVNNVS